MEPDGKIQKKINKGGVMKMKLLWEDVVKYGTKEEIQFLTELGGVVGDFMEILRRIRMSPNLIEKFSHELKIIDQKQKDGNLSQWINKDPEAKEILNRFKEALKISGGRIMSGAFASTR